MKSIIYFSLNPKDITRDEWTSYPGYTFVATLPRDHTRGDEVKGHLIRGVPCDCDPVAALDLAGIFKRPKETTLNAIPCE